MGEPTTRIRGLGEVALRVADLDAMHRFYREVVDWNCSAGSSTLSTSG